MPFNRLEAADLKRNSISKKSDVNKDAFDSNVLHYNMPDRPQKIVFNDHLVKYHIAYDP